MEQHGRQFTAQGTVLSMDTGLRRTTLFLLLIGLVCGLGLINGYINHLIARIPYAYWSVELLYWIVTPVAVITVAIRFGNLRLEEIGISRNIFGKRSVLLIIITTIAFAPLSHWWYREMYEFFHHQFPGRPFFAYQMVMPHDRTLRHLVSIYFALSAGIVEEIYYRGLFYKVTQFWPRPLLLYGLLSPIAFALVHWEGGLASMLSAYAFGMLMVFAFMLMRNLWPLIIGHIYTDYLWFS